MNIGRLIEAMAAATALAAATTACAADPMATRAHAPALTVVIYLTDDMNDSLAEASPDIAVIAAEGARFRLAAPPLCAPSRASLLTGQYVHNTGVFTNPGHNGHNGRTWIERHLGHTLADWLHDAGWRTIGAGKGVNNVPLRVLSSSGWDAWHESPARTSTEPYWLDVLTDQVVADIQATPADQPLLIYFAPQSPHYPFTPDPQFAGIYDDIPLPMPPSIWRNGATFPVAAELQVEALFHKRLEMLRSVRLSWERIEAALVDAGRAPRTWSFLTSDNGYSQGEGGRVDGKGLPYDEDMMVPAVAVGPGIRPGSTLDALVAIHDLAPTVAAIAGVKPDRAIDGRSFLPLLAGKKIPWRRRVLIEHHRGDGSLKYGGVRTAAEKIILWSDAAPERFDLAADPFELDDRCAGNPHCADGAAPFVDVLLSCSGVGCWELEMRP